MPGREAESGGGYRYGYQGQFAEEDGQAGWLSFELRNYDPRIARWTTIDPMEEFWSPYLGMGNDPINLTDPSGGSTAQPFDEWFFDANTGETHWISDTGGDELDIIHFGVINEHGDMIVNPEVAPLVLDVVQTESGEGWGLMSISNLQKSPGVRNTITSYYGTDAPGGVMDGLDDPIFNLLTMGGPGSVNELRWLGFAAYMKGGGDDVFRGLVKMCDETLEQGIANGAESIAGYSIYGSKGMVGSTFNRNIFLIEASGRKSLSGLRVLTQKLEAEALRNGASKISIYGAAVKNAGFLKPGIARRFGYSFEKHANGIILQKTLR